MTLIKVIGTIQYSAYHCLFVVKTVSLSFIVSEIFNIE